MQVKLDAFRALIAQKAGAVQAAGTRDGFCLRVGTATLGTDAGKERLFQNLTTLARFAKNENVAAMSLNLDVMPKPKQKFKSTLKAAAVAVKKKRAARKTAAV